MCALINYTLHEVRNYCQRLSNHWMQVSKSKRTSVSFDRESCTFTGLTSELLAELSALFPGINLRLELLKMTDWLCSTAGKNRKGTLPFITNWLSRVPKVNVAEPIPASLDTLVDSYLKDAWSKYDYLTSLNTKV